MTRIITSSLYELANMLEKRAYFNQALWLPGRSSRSYPGNNYQKQKEHLSMYVCPTCNERKYAMVGGQCPKCGAWMQRA
jgi:rubrerythrin